MENVHKCSLGEQNKILSKTFIFLLLPNIWMECFLNVLLCACELFLEHKCHLVWYFVSNQCNDIHTCLWICSQRVAKVISMYVCMLVTTCTRISSYDPDKRLHRFHRHTPVAPIITMQCVSGHCLLAVEVKRLCESEGVFHTLPSQSWHSESYCRSMCSSVSLTH